MQAHSGNVRKHAVHLYCSGHHKAMLSNFQHELDLAKLPALAPAAWCNDMDQCNNLLCN
jgi:hypothetical protein